LVPLIGVWVSRASKKQQQEEGKQKPIGTRNTWLGPKKQKKHSHHRRAAEGNQIETSAETRSDARDEQTLHACLRLPAGWGSPL